MPFIFSLDLLGMMIKHTLLILQLSCLSLSMGKELLEGLDVETAQSSWSLWSSWQHISSWQWLDDVGTFPTSIYSPPKNLKNPELLIEPVKV